FLSNGQYDVRLVAESPCDTDTTIYEVTINGYLGFTDLEKGLIRIKNLGNGIFNVQSDNTIIEMKVYNMEGREVSCPINETTIYLSKYKQGIYILKVETEKEVVSIRLVNI
ncbi:MAG: T9SS type A sorting domain-containing protein, partial [Flavobacteriales bacterium]